MGIRNLNGHYLVVVDILISCFIDNYTNKTRIMTKKKKTRKIKQ